MKFSVRKHGVVHRSGLQAQILTEGMIRVGDTLALG